jgi:hypothetical protein
MAEDHIRYDILAQEALRGVMRKVLAEVARTGLPGNHHFFITFLTNAPGVRISPRLREKYPEQMTIVIQFQYWDLKVSDTGFGSASPSPTCRSGWRSPSPRCAVSMIPR